MSSVSMGTEEINQFFKGDREEVLSRFVYSKLREIAAALVLKEKNPAIREHPTILVHELFLRWESKPLEFKSRQHFYRAVFVKMRHMLIDMADHHNAQKRGGEEEVMSFDESRDLGIVFDTREREKAEYCLAALRVVKRLSNEAFDVLAYKYSGWTEREIEVEMGLKNKDVKRHARIGREFLALELERYGL